MELKPYKKERNKIFTTATGKGTLKAVRDSIKDLPLEFTAGQMIDIACDIRGALSTWDVLNSLDYLTKLGLIVELTEGQDVAGQNRRYSRVIFIDILPQEKAQKILAMIAYGCFTENGFDNDSYRLLQFRVRDLVPPNTDISPFCPTSSYPTLTGDDVDAAAHEVAGKWYK